MKDENLQLLKPPTEIKRKRGQPTKFNPLQLKQIVKLTQIGTTDLDISEFLGIDEKTYINWKKAKPDFFQSIMQAKELADQKVEDSLYKKATGMRRKKQVLNSQDEIVELEEDVVPSDFAAFTWLKNRRKDRWTDRQEVEHSGEIKLIAVTVTQKQKSLEIEDKNTIDHEEDND